VLQQFGKKSSGRKTRPGVLFCVATVHCLSLPGWRKTSDEGKMVIYFSCLLIIYQYISLASPLRYRERLVIARLYEYMSAI